MINFKKAKSYCKEDISLIENYDKAMADSTQTWECHHRDEYKVLPSGMVVIRSCYELMENGRYYKCPANELIFLTKEEHMKIPCKKVVPNSSDIIEKRNTSIKKFHEENPGALVRSQFGKKFVEHFKIHRKDNYNLYSRENKFYRKHGHCSWEVENGRD